MKTTYIKCPENRKSVPSLCMFKGNAVKVRHNSQVKHFLLYSYISMVFFILSKTFSSFNEVT